jgi:hypothetical protein
MTPKQFSALVLQLLPYLAGLGFLLVALAGLIYLALRR